MSFRQGVPIALFVVLMASASVSYAFDWPCGVYYQNDGTGASDWFGMSVGGAGDVNADGYDDFIVGALYADPAARMNAGSIYVYSGLDGGLLYQKDGAAAQDLFGCSVAGAGDVNNDGYDDFIVGARETDPGALIDAGSAYVYSGRDGSLLYQKDGSDNGDNLGQSVAGAGDVNNDGYDDFIIGAPLADPSALPNAGSAYLYSGIDGSLLYLNPGLAADDRFGYSVDGAGDVNDDGYADFIVGAYGADPDGLMLAGSAYVFSGLTGAPIYKRDGEASADRFGLPVAGAGDVNNDGYDDFIVGANGADPNGIMNAGSAYVFSGVDGSLLYRRDGGATDDHFGMAVDGAGDVDIDGHDDFVVGAFYADPNGIMDAGSAYLYSGADGSLLYQADGTDTDEGFGTDVAGAGDINNDGYGDFIVGSPRADPDDAIDAGSAFVFVRRTITNTDVSDVPDDQGSQVRLRWSYNLSSDSLLDEFIIFRRFDPVSSIKYTPAAIFSGPDFPPGDWEVVSSFGAYGDTVYQTVVPTLVDSTLSEGAQYSVFFVRGRSTNPLLYIDSPVDSGYSVDNIAPAPPLSLQASTDGSDVSLTWQPVSDPDFQYYWVYRDVTPAFVPDPGKRIGATSDLTFVDGDTGGGPPWYYKVCAVDDAGNEGDPSNEVVIAACACDCHADPECDGFTNVLDVVRAVNVAFRGGADIPDPNAACPRVTTDVDCDGVTNVLDVVRLVNVAFRSGDPATQFCDPCVP